jgi:hypothetical protein
MLENGLQGLLPESHVYPAAENKTDQNRQNEEVRRSTIQVRMKHQRNMRQKLMSYV